MNWYLVKLIFKISTENGKSIPQMDEQWRLIEASDRGEALVKATALGEAESECFKNVSGETVKWEFKLVTDVQPFGYPTDGKEVFSKIEEPENEAMYWHQQQSKAMALTGQVSKVKAKA